MFLPKGLLSPLLSRDLAPFIRAQFLLDNTHGLWTCGNAEVGDWNKNQRRQKRTRKMKAAPIAKALGHLTRANVGTVGHDPVVRNETLCIDV